jgi:hypothetical protein
MECGKCIDHCSHGVYDAAKAPSPVVSNPSGCVDHCHGCGSICPEAAITYVGEDTGWMPPNGARGSEPSGCCCAEEPSDAKTVLVEYLYLDLQSCERCIGTDRVLDEVMEALTPVLQLAGYGVRYRKIEMKTAKLAEQFHFLSSPTIRVNGCDICQDVQENSCGCCSDISGTDVDCRVFRYEGTLYEVPPKEMLAQAVLSAVFDSSAAEYDRGGKYMLPENLNAFFKGKSKRSGCDCGGCR